jgi:lipid-A-disaccharide synthase
MKYYIIAGEASGDLHASNLVKALQELDPAFTARGWGGDLMKARGVDLVKHYRELAFMGFVEVIANLRTILRNITFCKKDIQQYRPDVLILVDYPGFNLRIADFARKEGLKVIYYISPQIWAWKQSRVHQIKRDVDRMLCILPFEKDFYSKFGVSVDFTGHPLLDAIASRNVSSNWKKDHQLDDKPLIAVLPGSRKQEIATMLPLMLSVADDFPNHRFVVAAAPSVEPEFYNRFTAGREVKLVFGKTYDLLENAEAALVTSGTATLETALFNVPQVVCYKGNKLSYHIARQLIKVKYISLVNLIMDEQVVTELIQDDLNTARIRAELSEVIAGGKRRENLLIQYSALKKKLGGPGASARAASIIMDQLKKG